MQLFENLVDPSLNLLPNDGIVNYYGKISQQDHADNYLAYLINHIAWRHDKSVIFGKHIVTKRKVAWYGDEKYDYTYSNTTKQALPWPNELFQLKTLVEEKTEESFNSCLLNLYHSGEEGMAWHRDEERDLKRNGAIASLSFGAERKFSMKHRQSDERMSIVLEHGSLLVMKGTTQSHWMHCMPKAKRIKTPRVNLTFRTIGE